MSVRDPPNNGFDEKIADSKNRDSRTLWAPSKIHLVPVLSNFWTLYNILTMNVVVKLKMVGKYVFYANCNLKKAPLIKERA